MDSNHSSYSYTPMNKSIAETDTITTEESGWTAYFEDFMVAQQQDHHQNRSFIDHHQQQQDHHHNHSFIDHHHQQQDHHHYNHSFIDHHQQQHELSDAASHVDWNYNNANSMNIGAALKFPKKLNLIKKASKRTREILYDDSLEDTASSPVNSPKVGSQGTGFNQIKVDDFIENSLENGGRFDGHLQLQNRQDQSRKMVFEETNIGSRDLRKRGLCLVPLSMFANVMQKI